MNIGIQRGGGTAAIAREVRFILPGSALSAVIALAATFISTLHGGRSSCTPCSSESLSTT